MSALRGWKWRATTIVILVFALIATVLVIDRTAAPAEAQPYFETAAAAPVAAANLAAQNCAPDDVVCNLRVKLSEVVDVTSRADAASQHLTDQVSAIEQYLDQPHGTFVPDEDAPPQQSELHETHPKNTLKISQENVQRFARRYEEIWHDDTNVLGNGIQSTLTDYEAGAVANARNALAIAVADSNLGTATDDLIASFILAEAAFALATGRDLTRRSTRVVFERTFVVMDHVRVEPTRVDDNVVQVVREFLDYYNRAVVEGGEVSFKQTFDATYGEGAHANLVDVVFQAVVVGALYADADTPKYNLISTLGGSAEAATVKRMYGTHFGASFAGFDGRDPFNIMTFVAFAWPQEPIESRVDRIANWADWAVGQGDETGGLAPLAAMFLIANASLAEQTSTEHDILSSNWNTTFSVPIGTRRLRRARKLWQTRCLQICPALFRDSRLREACSTACPSSTHTAAYFLKQLRLSISTICWSFASARSRFSYNSWC